MQQIVTLVNLKMASYLAFLLTISLKGMPIIKIAYDGDDMLQGHKSCDKASVPSQISFQHSPIAARSWLIVINCSNIQSTPMGRLGYPLSSIS